MNIIINRGNDGKQPPSAINKFDLGSERRRLVIETRKVREGLRCTAYAVQVSPCGHFETRAFGSTAASDYRRDVALRVGARGTEKALLELQAEGLAKLDELLAEARAYYVQQARARVAA